MSRRSNVLAAVYAAERVHKEFGTRDRLQDGPGHVDVFAIITAKGIPLVVQPLDQLLGAYLNDPEPGIIVTSKRPLSVQRFTAAHELGHAVMNHIPSFDDEEILSRALFSGAGYDPREIQANAFASHLLTPSWLIAEHMRRQEWSRAQLREPRVVYQLSLRMGSSYTATCFALESAGAIDADVRQQLLAKPRREIKQEFAGDYEPSHWYRDVWNVTPRDRGAVLLGSKSDLVVLQLDEHQGSGYKWQIDQLLEAGLVVEGDSISGSEGPDLPIGGPVRRTVVAAPQHEQGTEAIVTLQEVRPWLGEQDPHQQVSLHINFVGPYSRGLLPAQRTALLEVA